MATVGITHLVLHSDSPETYGTGALSTNLYNHGCLPITEFLYVSTCNILYIMNTSLSILMLVYENTHNALLKFTRKLHMTLRVDK